MQQLKKKLGSAFNGRYMSVEVPESIQIQQFQDDSEPTKKIRRSSNYLPFSVDPEYKRELTPMQALFNELVEYEVEKRKKQVEEIPWSCESKETWQDLGEERFPRYLRSLECSQSKCWYGHFTCRPKAFTVKILKRISSSCLYQTEKEDLRHNFVWEERAVNFACQCAP